MYCSFFLIFEVLLIFFCFFFFIEIILDTLPKKYQILLFSATMPKEVEGQIAAVLKHPVFTFEVSRGWGGCGDIPVW